MLSRDERFHTGRGCAPYSVHQTSVCADCGTTAVFATFSRIYYHFKATGLYIYAACMARGGDAVWSASNQRANLARPRLVVAARGWRMLHWTIWIGPSLEDACSHVPVHDAVVQVSMMLRNLGYHGHFPKRLDFERLVHEVENAKDGHDEESSEHGMGTGSTGGIADVLKRSGRLALLDRARQARYDREKRTLYG